MIKDEAYYREKLEESSVPEHNHDGLVMYLVHGVNPGSFLSAVIENDLAEACARADVTNAGALWNIVFFLYNYAPSAAWGREGVIAKWQEKVKAAMT